MSFVSFDPVNADGITSTKMIVEDSKRIDWGGTEVWVFHAKAPIRGIKLITLGLSVKTKSNTVLTFLKFPCGHFFPTVIKSINPNKNYSYMFRNPYEKNISIRIYYHDQKMSEQSENNHNRTVYNDIFMFRMLGIWLMMNTTNWVFEKLIHVFISGSFDSKVTDRRTDRVRHRKNDSCKSCCWAQGKTITKYLAILKWIRQITVDSAGNEWNSGCSLSKPWLLELRW